MAASAAVCVATATAPNAPDGFALPTGAPALPPLLPPVTVAGSDRVTSPSGIVIELASAPPPAAVSAASKPSVDTKQNAPPLATTAVAGGGAAPVAATPAPVPPPAVAPRLSLAEECTAAYRATLLIRRPAAPHQIESIHRMHEFFESTAPADIFGADTPSDPEDGEQFRREDSPEDKIWSGKTLAVCGLTVPLWLSVTIAQLYYHTHDPYESECTNTRFVSLLFSTQFGVLWALSLWFCVFKCVSTCTYDEACCGCCSVPVWEWYSFRAPLAYWRMGASIALLILYPLAMVIVACVYLFRPSNDPSYCFSFFDYHTYQLSVLSIAVCLWWCIGWAYVYARYVRSPYVVRAQRAYYIQAQRPMKPNYLPGYRQHEFIPKYRRAPNVSLPETTHWLCMHPKIGGPDFTLSVRDAGSSTGSRSIMFAFQQMAVQRELPLGIEWIDHQTGGPMTLPDLTGPNASLAASAAAGSSPRNSITSRGPAPALTPASAAATPLVGSVSINIAASGVRVEPSARVPLDVWLSIFRYLNANDAVRTLPFVSKRWRDTAKWDKLLPRWWLDLSGEKFSAAIPLRDAVRLCMRFERYFRGDYQLFFSNGYMDGDSRQKMLRVSGHRQYWIEGGEGGKTLFSSGHSYGPRVTVCSLVDLLQWRNSEGFFSTFSASGTEPCIVWFTHRLEFARVWRRVSADGRRRFNEIINFIPEKATTWNPKPPMIGPTIDWRDCDWSAELELIGCRDRIEADDTRLQTARTNASGKRMFVYYPEIVAEVDARTRAATASVDPARLPLELPSRAAMDDELASRRTEDILSRGAYTNLYSPVPVNDGPAGVRPLTLPATAGGDEKYAPRASPPPIDYLPRHALGCTRALDAATGRFLYDADTAINAIRLRIMGMRHRAYTTAIWINNHELTRSNSSEADQREMAAIYELPPPPPNPMAAAVAPPLNPALNCATGHTIPLTLAPLPPPTGTSGTPAPAGTPPASIAGAPPVAAAVQTSANGIALTVEVDEKRGDGGDNAGGVRGLDADSSEAASGGQTIRLIGHDVSFAARMRMLSRFIARHMYLKNE